MRFEDVPMLAEEQDEQSALVGVSEALKNVDTDAKARILRAVATFYGLDLQPDHDHGVAPPRAHDPISSNTAMDRQREPVFSGHPDLSPKEFLEEKQPSSDVDRVACLAYYLGHYRNTRHFKTVDISKLNTEAAQFKFSNAANSVNNAAWRGLLTSAGRGNKQISAIGEQFVAALPDRDAAKRVLARIRFRRDRGRSRARHTSKVHHEVAQ
jgi:hypothetical protein